jgi:hypothetical protein
MVKEIKYINLYMSSFDRNIPFPDNPKFINVEGQGLTILENENDQELKGNLENVDEKKLLHLCTFKTPTF